MLQAEYEAQVAAWHEEQAAKGTAYAEAVAARQVRELDRAGACAQALADAGIASLMQAVPGGARWEARDDAIHARWEGGATDVIAAVRACYETCIGPLSKDLQLEPPPDKPQPAPPPLHPVAFDDEEQAPVEAVPAEV